MSFPLCLHFHMLLLPFSRCATLCMNPYKFFIGFRLQLPFQQLIWLNMCSNERKKKTKRGDRNLSCINSCLSCTLVKLWPYMWLHISHHSLCYLLSSNVPSQLLSNWANMWPKLVFSRVHKLITGASLIIFWCHFCTL